MRSGARWSGVAAIAAVALVAGAISGAGAASGVQQVAMDLAYTCTFPSGAQPVGVHLTVTLPSAGTIGTPIQPTGAGLTATVPEAAIGDLTTLGTASVTSTAALTTTITQHGTSSPAAWSGFTGARTPIPSTGNLVLTESGAVPPVTVSSAGDVTFTAGALSLVLTPSKSDGTATTPATLTLPCTLNSGQNALLGTVPVPDLASPPPPTTSGQPTPGNGAPVVGPPPSAPTVPAGPISNATPGHLLGYLSGRSNVRKLGNATLIGPGQLTVTLTGIIKIVNGELHSYDTAVLDLPDTTATYLDFGFMPTTVTMKLFPVPGPGGQISLDTASPLKPPYTPSTTATSEMYARIDGATVNGTPLPIGTQCQTTLPIQVTLHSESDYKGVQQGGHLSGTVTIPPFAHCGLTENLDSLINASVAGPGNFMRMQQGSLCVLVNGSTGTCVPGKPTP